MAQITEDYVSFEIAKLLKKRGFEPPHDYRKWLPNMYTDNGEIKWGVWSDDWYPRITLQMTMKWLREVHRLHIEVVPYPFNFEHQDIQDGWGCEVTHLSDLSYDGNYEFFQKKYSTYEEACESAIRYCLENLI